MMQKINEQGNISFKESILDFFHGLLDFKGITTQKGYLFPLIYYYGILFSGITLLGIFILMDSHNLFIVFLEIIVLLNFIFSNLAIIPVTVRRFRDIGFNIFTTIILLILALSLCPILGAILPTNLLKNEKKNR